MIQERKEGAVMPEPVTPPAARPSAASRFGAGIGRFLVRAYALIILLVVLWTGYTAISYLARYVFRAGQVPAQYLDPLAAGVPASQPPRDGEMPAPLVAPGISRYHRDPQPFEFIGVAGCTTSGCHTLLPHTKKKEIRAFANF